MADFQTLRLKKQVSMLRRIFKIRRQEFIIKKKTFLKNNDRFSNLMTLNKVNDGRCVD